MDAGTSELVERHWLSWAYSGVDPSIPGNGGDECMALIPSVQKILETVVLVAVAVIQISYAWPKLNITDAIPSVTSSETTGRRFLLMTMCLIFGTEIGFKLASRQMIWILNQCHVVTILQVNSYLLLVYFVTAGLMLDQCLLLNLECVQLYFRKS